MYDLIVAGGGIAGLYSIYKYIKNHKGNLNLKKDKILLIESSSRLGGRIKTIHNQGQTYESGAGRFSNNHILLMELIQDFNLQDKIFPIKSKKLFMSLHHPGEQILLTNQIDKSLRELMDYIKNKKMTEDDLLATTLFDIAKEYSSKLADDLANMYPYYSEVRVMNANEGLKLMNRDFSSKVKYFVLAGGLEQLITKLEEFIHKNNKLMGRSVEVEIRLNTSLENIKEFKERNGYQIETSNDKEWIETRNLFLAIPTKALLQIPFLIKYKMERLLKTVSPQPLYRIYVKYKTAFLDKQIITDSELRFVIPYNKDGLMMISYTDGGDTNFWLKQYIKSEDKLLEVIHQKLKELIPDIKIPEVEWIDASSAYWDAGAHYWKPRKQYTNQSQLAFNLYNPFDNMWIIGEAYSDYQAWIEGALRTSLEAIEGLNGLHMLPQPKILEGGGMNTKFTKEEVARHHTKDDAWLIINNGVYDITKWIPDHPGGMIIMKGVGKDATELFKSIGHDNYAKEKLKTFKIGTVGL